MGAQILQLILKSTSTQVYVPGPSQVDSASTFSERICWWNTFSFSKQKVAKEREKFSFLS